MQSVLSVVTLTPRRSLAAFDATLRDALEAIATTNGCIFVCAGRTGPDDGNRRVLVSMWATADALTAGLHPRLASFPAEGVEISEEAPYRAENREWYGSSLDPRIVRVTHVQVRSGALEAAVAAAVEIGKSWRNGPESLLASAIASCPPDRYIGVTLWSTWDGIDEWTAGNRRAPIRGPGDVQWDLAVEVQHYEVFAWRRSGVSARETVAPLDKR